jgi:hypothetical protein
MEFSKFLKKNQLDIKRAGTIIFKTNIALEVSLRDMLSKEPMCWECLGEGWPTGHWLSAQHCPPPHSFIIIIVVVLGGGTLEYLQKLLQYQIYHI